MTTPNKPPTTPTNPPPTIPTPDAPNPLPPLEPKRTQKDPPNEPKKAPVQEPPTGPNEPNSPVVADEDAHEGAIGTEVGDRTGPGAGFDDEPESVKDKGGVASS
jgi:hypothetical protein